jgi:hypothetical protein
MDFQHFISLLIPVSFAINFMFLDLLDDVLVLRILMIMLHSLHAVHVDVVRTSNCRIDNVPAPSGKAFPSSFVALANSAKDFFTNLPFALTTIVDCTTGLPGEDSPS